jgi:ABC-2 type transport system permease protein
MLSFVLDTWRNRAVVTHFVGVQLTTSYRTKSLGFLWALLDPLLFMCVYYIVFGRIIAMRPLSFMIHLFVGVIAFRFLQGSAAQAAGVLRAHGGLIKEIRFPKVALPLSVIIARLFDFGAGWLIAIPLGFAFGYPPTPYWLAIPLFVAIQILFVAGFSLVTAYIGLFFADVENILAVLLRLWFYLSPVLYGLELVRQRTEASPFLYRLYLLNPMVSIIECYQACVQRAQWPAVQFVSYALVSSIATLLIGVLVFRRMEGQVAKYV